MTSLADGANSYRQKYNSKYSVLPVEVCTVVAAVASMQAEHRAISQVFTFFVHCLAPLCLSITRSIVHNWSCVV